MKEETLPLFPTSTNYRTHTNKNGSFTKNTSKKKQNHHTDSNENGPMRRDVEKAEITFNEGVATSLRCEDGVYRRLYQQTSSSYTTHSDSEDEEHWGGLNKRAMRTHPTSCRWFLFCMIVIFFLFLLYVPAYNNVIFRPDTNRTHEADHAQVLLHQTSERVFKLSRGSTKTHITGTVAGWSFNKSRNMRTYVLPDNVTVLNQPKSICKPKFQLTHEKHSTPGPPEPEIFLLVIITSSMSHYDRRMAIRQTWGNQTSNEVLWKHFENVRERFANVNVTESLFSELGYLSYNVSLDDKKERIKREILSDIEDEYLIKDGDTVPTLDQGNQIVNSIDNSSDNLIESHSSSSNEKNKFSLKGNEALLESLIDESSKYNNLDSSKQSILYSNIYKHLDRKMSTQSFTQILFQNQSTPYRQRREITTEDKTQTENDDKRAIYDEVEENVDDNILGNFETTDPEPSDVLDDYDYQTEESNVMRIPRRGEETDVDDENIRKVLQDVRKNLLLTLQNEKSNLELSSNKNVNDDKIKDNAIKSDWKTNDLIKHPNKEVTKVQMEKKDSKIEKQGSASVKTKFLFLLGQSAENDTDLQAKIDEETAMFGDIIQEGFIDSYNNLTLKSVMLLKWVISNCEDNVHYIMKTDDDMFINVPRLIEALKSKSHEYKAKYMSMHSKPETTPFVGEKLLMGDLICDARPISDMRSKWYSPTYMFSGKVYPKYLSGVSYVMSMSTAKDLYQAALDTPLFHLEDVFITGICSHKAGIKPLDHPGFSYVKRKFMMCIYAYMISAHRVTPNQMKQMYSSLISNNTRQLEACEAKRLYEINKAKKHVSGKNLGFGNKLLGSPRNIITGLAGFGSSDARKKKLKKANNGCS